MSAPLDRLVAEADAALADVDAVLASDEDRRAAASARGPEPVHVCYVPADRVSATTAQAWGTAALEALDTWSGLVGDVGEDLPAVLPRVRRVLGSCPVADLRADLEDGYGHRGDDVEDADAAHAGAAVAAVLAGERAPWRAGPRVKSMEAATRRRGLRSWALFLDAFLDAGGDPGRLRVTLPKVSAPEQVAAFVAACASLETSRGLDPIPVEIQVETPRAVLTGVTSLIDAAGGRCAGLHYGTYDYSAALGIAPDQQRADHPAAEHAKAVLQVAGAALGVPVCDGSSALLPVGSASDVLEAWRAQARIVRRALELGIGQGWDMHPGNVPIRLAVVHAVHRAGAPRAVERLRAYREGAASGVLDEPATERALVAFLRRGLACGALDADEVAGLA
ncbi:aldolase [Actinomycetospora sp. NBRC 106375]|uniref:DUF6986 family protein n=1 Tax=Actinomycetospora sp. NBRC 106375 TaxID=3032207 RepID=UPI0024A12AC1|nr:aldolase/citrate lyase family protein [Actinomycetospora sp. NBRC 106375]GLZ44516.1 aldolase [Actinomycetospora sp. NBRC 106375]